MGWNKSEYVVALQWKERQIYRMASRPLGVADLERTRNLSSRLTLLRSGTIGTMTTMTLSYARGLSGVTRI